MTTSKKTRTPDPSITRSNRDWLMIIIGMCLVVVFAIGIYLSLGPGEPAKKLHGPVKDPSALMKPGQSEK